MISSLTHKNTEQRKQALKVIKTIKDNGMKSCIMQSLDDAREMRAKGYNVRIGRGRYWKTPKVKHQWDRLS